MTMVKSLNSRDVKSPPKHSLDGLHKRVEVISLLSEAEDAALSAKPQKAQADTVAKQNTSSQYHNSFNQDRGRQKKEKHMSKKLCPTPVSKAINEDCISGNKQASDSEVRKENLTRSSPIRKSPALSSKPLKAISILVLSEPPANWSEYKSFKTLSEIPQDHILESIETSDTPPTKKRRRNSNVFPSSTPSDDGLHRSANITESSKHGGIAVTSQPNTHRNDAVQSLLQNQKIAYPGVTPSQTYSLSTKDSASGFSRSISSLNNSQPRTPGTGRIPYASRNSAERPQDTKPRPNLPSTEFSLELNNIPRTKRRPKRLTNSTELARYSWLPESDFNKAPMQEFHNSPGRTGLRPRAVSENEKQILNRKWKAKYRNHPFMIHLNSLDNQQDLGIVNEVDDEPPPQDFRFITKNIFSGEAIEPDPAAIYGCSCESNCDPKSCSCVLERSFQIEPDGKTWGLPYNNSEAERRLTHAYLNSQLAIHECNAACLCPPTCRNRRITLPNDLYLEIFKTGDRGWGLRSKDFIPKGSFVDTYCGEVLTEEEASKRSEQSTGKNVYLFNLDAFAVDIPPGEKHYVVDAEFFGSAARFINHSCDPNLRVFCVSLLRGNPRIYELALFAIRDIMPGEELCFDYQSKDSNDEILLESSPELGGEGEQGFDCRCGAPQCRRRCW